MPSTRIESAAGWIGDRHAALIDAVQRAMVEGLRIPEGDRAIRILEYPPASFSVPVGHGERYTIIEVNMFAGRSVDAKRRLYAALARELAGFGIPEADLMVILHDVPLDDWGRRGRPASEQELGFDINV